MAIATSQVAVTSEWQKVSDSDCTIQSSLNGVYYQVAIGTSEPSGACLTINLDDPKTFAYKEPVWVRLVEKGRASNQRIINIIK